jgi:FixJ family two-component response regulator
MFTVFIVDDDPGMVKALSRLMLVKGYDVRAYTSPHEFLEDHDPEVPGCALLDVAMPELNGLELQRELSSKGSHRPIIFITGKGDIPTTVRAMQAGAIDFLTKPLSNRDLLAVIARAEQQDAQSRQADLELRSIQARIATLTPREHEVFTHVVGGRLNKQIAYDLGTAEKTIKFHRSSVMRKLRVRMVADLVHLAARAGIRR